MRTWFAVDNSLVDRNDLTAYEKLCGMVLARYAGRPEFDHLLTSDIIAVKMGVTSDCALKALKGLVSKGLIDVETTSDLFVDGQNNPIRDVEVGEYEDSHVIKEGHLDQTPEPVHFEHVDFEQKPSRLDAFKEIKEEEHALSAVQTPAFSDANFENQSTPVPADSQVEAEVSDADLNKSIHEQSASVREWIEQSESERAPRSAPKVQNVSREALVSEVLEHIEEPINDRQARIILGLAAYDMDKVKQCYSIAQRSQLSDKIDVLIHELQKGSAVQEVKRQPRSSQVDHMKLNQMKKYQAMKNTKF